MAKTGRPATPTKLKILRGNPGKRAINKNEPDPPPAEGAAPSHLDAGAVAFWNEHAPGLLDDGLLTTRDVPEFAAACQQHSLYERLMKKLNLHPFAREADELQRRALKALDARDRILNGFGFRPSDRAKITIKPKTADPFADFLGKKKA